MSARPDLAGVLAEHRYVYGQQIGLLCRCGEPDPFGQRQGNGAAAHRAHLAAALNAAIDAWLADEGTREAVGAAIYEATYEVGIDDGVTLDQGRDIAATALTALTTPTTTEDHR